MNLSHSITIRNALPSDHKTVLSVIPEWWGGRDLRSSLPKLFFLHFGNSSFIAEKNGILCGFLVRAIAYKLGTVFNFQRFWTLMPYSDFACDCLYKSNVLESLDLKSYLR